MEILNPAAPSLVQQSIRRRTLAGLQGCTIGFIDNSKPNFGYLVDDLAEILVNAYGAKKVLKRVKRTASMGADSAVIDELVRDCDLIIAGSGD